MKLIRILIRNYRDSFRSVLRNFSLSIASITCTSITLILVALAIIISANVNNFTKSLEDELTIIVYLAEDVTPEGALNIQNTIMEMNTYDSLDYKSKDMWKEEIQSTSEELNTTLGFLSENPLLDSIVVKVKDVRDLSSTTEEIRKIEGVISAKYGEDTVDKMIFIFDVIEKTTLVIVAALILVTAFLISNTIKLTIVSRKSEIEIMRLVGTSNFVIRQPFIIEGFIIGLLGSIIPVVITVYGYILFYDHFDGHLFSYIIELIPPMKLVWMVSLVIAVVGSVVGMLGSGRAVRKYLKI